MSPSLISRDNTNTGLLIFVPISMFTLFTTILVSYSALTFIFHSLFGCNTLANLCLILLHLIFFSLLYTFVLPLLINWLAATWYGLWWWGWRWWTWLIILLLNAAVILIFLIIRNGHIFVSLIGDIFKERITSIIRLLLLIILFVHHIHLLSLIVRIAHGFLNMIRVVDIYIKFYT